MQLYLSDLEREIKKVPIGYYLKKKANKNAYDINLSASKDDKCSFFNPVDNSIVISLQQVNNALATSKSDDVESTVRAVIYHEISHAMYTPADWKMDYIVNVLEDERIETFNSNLFAKVDFKKNILNVCGYNSIEDVPEPTTLREKFFYTVRFRKGNPKAIENMLILFRHITVSPKAYYDFFKDFFGDIEDLDEPCEPSPSPFSSSITKSDIEQFKRIENDLHEFYATSAVATLINRAKVENPHCFDYLFENYKKRGTSRAQEFAHFGVFNPKGVLRDDYRFFNKCGSGVSGNQFTNFHLNLFIDTSGSFSYNDRTVNKMLKNLAELERSNNFFTFSVVSCSVGEKVLPNKARFITSFGGNDLDEKIFSIFRSLQKPMTNVYNIVLFDGDAFSDSPSNRRDGHTFSAFDTINTTIISDTDNRCYIEKNVSKARVIYTDDYTAELQQEVFNALKVAMT